MLGGMSAPADTITWLADDVVARLLPDWAGQVDLLDRTYRAMAAGEVENPPKLGVHPREHAFLHAMPAYVRDRDVTAMKWVSAYPGNPARGLPYISGVIVLSDSDTGLPLAIMAASAVTATRTAAATGVSLRHLAHPGWRRVAVLGHGAQGRAHVRMVRALRPEAEVRVYGGPRRRPDVDEGVSVAESAEEAVTGADVVITTGPMDADPDRRIDPEWLADQVLVLPVDFDAYVDAGLASRADDVVVDDVAQFAHHRSGGRFAGWPAPRCSLGEALGSPPVGDLRVSCSLGVGAADAVLADEVWRRAQRDGLGLALPR